MALFGSCAFGIVMGWLAVLIHRPAQAVSAGLAWRSVSAVLVGWARASALPWLYVGWQGFLIAALGAALGTLIALALFEPAHHAQR